MTTKKPAKSKITGVEIRKLVVARLKTLPSGKQISIGNEGSFTKDELIARVQSGDAVGEKMVKIELEFLRAMKAGVLFDEPTSTSDQA